MPYHNALHGIALDCDALDAFERLTISRYVVGIKPERLSTLTMLNVLTTVSVLFQIMFGDFVNYDVKSAG